MIPIAVAKSTPAGFLLVTNDAEQDELAGPFASYQELEMTARDIGVDFELPSNIRPKLRDLTIGALFRTGSYWYRLRDRDGKHAVLDVVGEKRQETMPWSTDVTEISVLSLR